MGWWVWVVLYLYDLVHLYCCDNTVTIEVKHPENLTHHFLWSAITHDVEDKHELSEVNVATAVGVVYSGKGRILQNLPVNLIFSVKPLVLFAFMLLLVLPSSPVMPAFVNSYSKFCIFIFYN